MIAQAMASVILIHNVFVMTLILVVTVLYELVQSIMLGLVLEPLLIMPTTKSLNVVELVCVIEAQVYVRVTPLMKALLASE